MNPQDTRQRVLAAHKLLFEETTTREKFESIRALIKGLNPRVDQTLDATSKALSDFERFKQGDVIALSAEHLPENTEEEKERKRRLLFFIRTYKDLRSEVDRVKNEFDQRPNDQKAQHAGRILAGAKGPFGIITLAAIVIVGVGAYTLFNTSEKEPTRVESSVKGETSVVSPAAKTTIQVIEFNGKQIPLSETVVGIGPECDNAEHYHTKDHTAAKALDGTTVSDPGACGFGKVSEVVVMEVAQ